MRPKLLLVTTPIRPVPTQFPPIGALSLIKSLKARDKCDVEFYNIDANRPTYDEALAYIVRQAPTIFAISAVVSTAYEYTKRLSLDVKKALPDTVIACGGNLAASAEVLLKRTGVDVCILGEGEKILCNLVEKAHSNKNSEYFSEIPGLVYLCSSGTLVNSGFETPLDKSEIYDFDWTDLIDSLENKEDIDRFIYDPFSAGANGQVVDWFRFDSRTYQSHREGKKVGQLPGAKGCVARCTFCHRWDKGIRYIPVPQIMNRLDYLKENFNVGFLTIVDENFGTSKKWLAEFCEEIKKRDVLWSVAGMRVNCIDLSRIKRMKEAGCTSILYGMETGSEKILEVMEKRVKIEDNYNAMEWTVDNQLHTVIQLVIGMPGESPSTIRETIGFAAESLSLSPEQNPNWLSINYAQALPGTPLYEHARMIGALGSSLDDEEGYLLEISDTNAHDESTSINFTDFPQLIRKGWRPLIQISVNYAYVKKYGIHHYHDVLIRDTVNSSSDAKSPQDQGFFAKPKKNLSEIQITTQDGAEFQNFGGKSKKEFWRADDSKDKGLVIPKLSVLLRKKRFGLAMLAYPHVFYRLKFLIKLGVLWREYNKHGLTSSFNMAVEYILFGLGRRKKGHKLTEAKSLRKLVAGFLDEQDQKNPAMTALRKGR